MLESFSSRAALQDTDYAGKPELDGASIYLSIVMPIEVGGLGQTIWADLGLVEPSANIPGVARSSVTAEDTSNAHGPSRGSGSSKFFCVVCAFGCQAPGQDRGQADNAGSLSRFIVSKSLSLNAFKAAVSSRPSHRPPNGLSGMRLGTVAPTHGDTPLTDLALRRTMSCLQAVLRNISRWKTVAPERGA